MDAHAFACVYIFVVRARPIFASHTCTCPVPSLQVVSSASWRAHWSGPPTPAAAAVALAASRERRASLAGSTDPAHAARRWGVAEVAGTAALWRAFVRWCAARGKAVQRTELEAAAAQWCAPHLHVPHAPRPAS